MAKAGCDIQRQLNAAITAADVTTILRLLDDRSLDLDARDLGHDLQTPLMRVCHMPVETEELRAILDKLEHCAWNPNVQDATGRALLMHGCIADNIYVVDMCLANGCDVSLVDRDGNSAIIYAIRSGNDSMLGLILEQEECLPLLTQTNNTGHMPIEVAQMEGHVSMVKQLAALMPSQHTNSNHKVKVKGDKSPRKVKRQDSLGHNILDTNGLPNSSRKESYMWQRENGHTTDRASNSQLPPRVSDIVVSRNEGRREDHRVSIPPAHTYSHAEMTSQSGERTGRQDGEKRHKNSLESSGKPKKSQRLLQRDTDDPVPSPDDNVHSTQRNKALFCRKDSTSLPDLRDFKGKLITSGDVMPSDPNSALDPPESGKAGEVREEEEEEEDVFAPSESYLELYQKAGSTCSLPPLLSNSADSDRRRERGGHKHGRSKPRKTNSHEDVMLRSLIV